jgi:hypothetical protein
MSILCDGRQFAFTYQAVQIAAGTDKDFPAFYRTMVVDVFPGGIRLVAFDLSLVLVGWVERLDIIGDTNRVEDGEVPDESYVIRDPSLRLLEMMKDVHTTTKDSLPIQLQIRRGSIGPTTQPALDGFEIERLTFEAPDVKAVVVEVSPTAFPNWRIPHDAEPTAEIGLGVGAILKLGKLAKLHEGAHVRMTFSGQHGAALVQLEAPGTNEVFDIRGLAMPTRLSDEFRTEWGPISIPTDASDLDDESSDAFADAVQDQFPGATVSVAGNVTTINVPMGDND